MQLVQRSILRICEKPLDFQTCFFCKTESEKLKVGN